MQTLHAVTKDLAYFVFVEYFGFREPQPTTLTLEAGIKNTPAKLSVSVDESRSNPQFISGEHYSVDDSKTQTVRSVAAVAQLRVDPNEVLQDIEYITYRLAKKQISIPESGTAPYVAGSWQRRLRGKPGVHIGVVPRVDAVMETIDDEGIGRLRYVDAVFPDDSIVVSEFGYPEHGMFLAQTIQKDEWKEQRPVFIEIT